MSSYCTSDCDTVFLFLTTWDVLQLEILLFYSCALAENFANEICHDINN